MYLRIRAARYININFSNIEVSFFKGICNNTFLVNTVIPYIVRLLVATLHVGMTGKQDGSYTQLTSTGVSSPGRNIIHSLVVRVAYG